MKQLTKTMSGSTFPLGATAYEDGVNFSIYSKFATGMELLLFDSEESPVPSKVFRLDPQTNKTTYYWHVFVPELKPGQIYAYRAFGPYDPARGLRFNAEKTLLDPYGRAVVNWGNYDRRLAIEPGDNCSVSLRNAVVDPKDYDWEGDRPLRHPYATTVIYEMHVGGFTRHESSGVSPEKRGTFAGVIEKIPYLVDLGVTAIELMPVHAFDPQDARPGLTNYWGYSTIGFFAPHYQYCANKDPLGAVNEFRDMVKALHRAGIEVILDVVFNHTAEGDENGPTLSFKGLDNRTYYILERPDHTHYMNFSGCGNTMKANHPVVGRMVLDSLRYWVSEMHVDGFRFDLASVFARDVFGVPVKRPPLLWNIEADAVLAGSKLIAEAWDAAGLYSVGQFVNSGDWFAEWNGPFRDDVRRFLKGDTGCIKSFASRLIGSPDIYHSNREPNRSINFVTCHDGFTLNDLVSYNEKHNEMNGEQNRDGANSNYSWNLGHEGPVADGSPIDLQRTRQAKNFLCSVLLSHGTPMLLMGDEVRRSQAGNNNGYGQDNKLSWLDWRLGDKHAGLLRFTQKLIHFTQSLELFRQKTAFAMDGSVEVPHITWHGVKLWSPDWSDNSHSLAMTFADPAAGERMHVIFNAYWEPLEFDVPAPSMKYDYGQKWYRIIDTSKPSPDDFVERKTEVLTAGTYIVQPRSCVVLFEDD